jgi:peptide deformylase
MHDCPTNRPDGKSRINVFAPEIAELIQDMADSMAAAGGIGIAAPQIGVPLRVVMFHAPAEADEGGDSTDAAHRAEVMTRPLTILINPEIEILTDETASGWEGCLSVPGLRGVVPRYTRLRYSGLTPSGERIQRIATDFHAVVVQHECDHLDGILYPMRMTDMSTLQFVAEMQRLAAAAGQNPVDEVLE